MNRRVLILLLCALAIAHLAVATLLPAHWDWTRQREFTLSPHTAAVLHQLSQPAHVVLLASRKSRTAADRSFEPVRLMMHELLPLYVRAQSLLEYHDLDPELDPAARRWQQRFPDAVAPCVIVAAGRQQATPHEVLSARDLLEIEGGHRGSVAAVEFRGERALTTAISRISGSQQASAVYALTGHGELDPGDESPESRRGLGVFAQRAAEAGISVRPLNPGAVERIPADAEGLIIAGPERALDRDESQKLRHYLARGGRLLLLCDAVPTGLEDLLTELGVTIGRDYIVTRGVTGRQELASPALPGDANHPLVRTLSSSRLTLYECRSVRALLGVNEPTTAVIPLLLSHPAPRAWAEVDLAAAGDPRLDGDDLPGPVAMAVAVEDIRGQTHEPRLVVVGDAEFASNHSLTGDDGPEGYHFLLSSLNWLRGRKASLADIPSKRQAAYQLSGTPADQRDLVWKPALLMAALIITAGATVWVVRRPTTG